jgi:hypothetical protein
MSAYFSTAATGSPERRVWPHNPSDWPEHIDALPDSFMGEVFLGPLN